MKHKFSVSLTLALILAMVVTSLALADPIVNNIDTTIDSALEIRTIAPGGSTVVGFFIVGSNTDPSPDASGCNATGANPATVTLNVPANVTATPPSFQVVGCYDPTTATGTVVNVTFSSSTAGSYTIAVASVTGGKSGSQWNTAPASFTLNVVSLDSTPPVLHLPSNITAEATGPFGADVTFTATADDANPAHPAVTCNPASGSTFALGTTTVNCSATDAAGNIATASFTVTVVDTTAPTLVGMPGDITVEGNTTDGANVPFTAPTATDIVDASPSVSCSANSGDFFPLGTTTVTCTATDDFSNSSSDSFDVTVVDTIAPTLVGMPGDMTVEGNTTGGANVPFTVPTATDIVDANPSVSCVPASGSFFALGGPHAVTCMATDASNNSSSASFNVTVVDTTAPVLHDMPTDMTVEGNTVGGANVTYTAPTATDIVDASPDVSCSANPGDFFPLGTTAVTCTATDDSLNSSSASFNVTVADTTPPSITCPANISGTVGQVVVLGSPTVSDIVDASPAVTNDAPGSFGPGTTPVTWTASDDSGNSASCSQTVTLTYVWLGFFQPVDNLPLVNKAKAGQAIPFKWALKDANGNFVSDLSTVQSYGYGSLACGSGTTDLIESYDTTGASGLRYDPIANQFIFTSKTEKSWATLCKTFTLKLSDGTQHQASFNFVK